MKNKTLIIIGVAVFFAGLLIQAPARLVTLFLPADSISMSGVSGSLWNGSAERINVDGFLLNRTSWNLHVLSLLTGRAAADVATSWSNSEISGYVSASAGGSLNVSELEGFIDLNTLRGAMDFPVGGMARISVEELAVSDNWPEALVADIEVRDLTFPDPINRRNIAVGNFSLSFAAPDINADDIVEGLLTDAGGPLELNGKVLLTPPNSYSMNADVKARPEASKDLSDGLRMMAPANARGYHEFALSSSF